MSMDISSEAAPDPLDREYSVVVPTTVLCVCTPVDDELNWIVAWELVSPHFGLVIVPIRPFPPIVTSPMSGHLNVAKWPPLGVTSIPGPVAFVTESSTVRRWNSRVGVVIVPSG